MDEQEEKEKSDNSTMPTDKSRRHAEKFLNNYLITIKVTIQSKIINKYLKMLNG